MADINERTGNTRYPLQCFAVVRQQTFAVNARLTCPEKQSMPPLEFYHPKFALFQFSVFKGGQSDPLTANMNIKYVSYLVEQSKLCLQQELKCKFNPDEAKASQEKETDASAAGTSPAYSLKFLAGPYKGKTPAAVAVMDNGLQILRNQYTQLQNNLEKYPGNQKLMDAIIEAGNLQKQGKLIPEKKSADIAYTVCFKAGNLKGKTPAQVLLEDPAGGAATLQNQRIFLAKNVAQYPANQDVIDAIDAANALLAAGQLSGERVNNAVQTASACTGYVLHDKDFMCHVDQNRPGYNPNDPVDVAHLRITWEFGMNYPVCIWIENYQARVSKGADGKQNVDSNHINVVQMSMKITAGEWFDCLQRMQTAMRTFEMLHARDAFADAVRMEKENALAAKAARVQENS